MNKIRTTKTKDGLNVLVPIEDKKGGDYKYESRALVRSIKRQLNDSREEARALLKTFREAAGLDDDAPADQVQDALTSDQDDELLQITCQQASILTIAPDGQPDLGDVLWEQYLADAMTENDMFILLDALLTAVGKQSAS